MKVRISLFSWGVMATLISFIGCAPEELTIDTVSTADSTDAEGGFETFAVSDSGNVDQGQSRLRAAGAQSVTAAYITVTQSGFPDATGAFSFHTDTDLTTEYGGDSYVVPTGFETVVWDTSADGYRNVRGIGRPDGTSLIVAEKWTGTDAVVVYEGTEASLSAERSYSLLATIYSSATYTYTGAYVRPSPDICAGEGERVYVGSLEPTGTASVRLRIDKSDDGGTTWYTVSRTLAFSALSGTEYYDDLRLVRSGKSGNLYLAIHHNNGGTHTGVLYVSTNDGVSWTSLQTVTDVRVHELKMVGDVPVYVYINGSNAMKSLYGAGGGFLSTPTQPGGTWSTGHLAGVVSPRGYLIVYGRPNSGTPRVQHIMTIDAGQTWGSYADGYPYDSGDPNVVFTDSTGGFTSGQVFNGAYFVAPGAIMLTGKSFTINAGTRYGIGLMRFGGVSNVTYDYDPTQDNLTWLPIDLPSVRGWTLTGAGTASITSTPYLEIQTVANQAQYHYAPASTTTCLQWRVKVTFNGSTSADDVAVRATLNVLGVSGYDVRVRMASNGDVALWDQNAGANIATVSTGVVAGWLDFRMALDTSDRVSLWYKTAASAKWIAIVEAGDIDAGTAAADSRTRWGHLSASGTATSQWAFFSQSTSGSTDGSIAYGQVNAPRANTADQDASVLLGLDASGKPLRLPIASYVWVGGNVSMGDTYTCTRVSRTPMTNLIDMGRPSPRQPFKSKDISESPLSAGGTINIIYDLGEYYDGRFGFAIGLCKLNADSYLHTLQGSTDGTTSNWDDILTLDSRESFGSPAWALDGQWLTPNGANAIDRRRFRRDELKGTVLHLNDGTNNVYVRVLSNTDGQFSTTSGVLQLRIQLEATPLSGTFASLPASVNAGTGDIAIHWKDAAVLGTQTANAVRYLRQQILIPSYWTGQLTVGKAFPVKLEGIDRQHEKGDTIVYEARDIIDQLPYGFTQGRRLADMGRARKMSFRHQPRQSFQSADAASTLSINSVPHAIRGGVVDHLISAVERQGHSKPMFVTEPLELASDLASSNVTLYGKRQWYHCNLVGDPQVTTRSGLLYGDTNGRQDQWADVDLTIVEIV